MLEILKFIFSSFWIWLGTLILWAVTLQGVAAGLVLTAKAMKPKKARQRKYVRRFGRRRSNPEWPKEVETEPSTNN